VQKKRNLMVKKVIFAVLLLYTMLIASITIFQEKLIFLPTDLPQEYAYSFTQPFEEVNLTAKDGAILNAIHFKTEHPKGVILYFHGNSGDLSRWGEITSYFTQFGYDVLVMDYRTYGKSSGKLSEEALYEDAQLFYTYLLENYAESSILVYGRSLGTTFATAVAATNHPKMLILETPFYNLHSVAKKRFPIFPIDYLLKYSFETNQLMQQVDCDLVVFHGTEDKVVPFASGKRLFDSAPSIQKEFIKISGAEHNNLIDFELYHTVIKRLLQ